MLDTHREKSILRDGAICTLQYRSPTFERREYSPSSRDGTTEREGTGKYIRSAGALRARSAFRSPPRLR
jgi:hypothetical protein